MELEPGEGWQEQWKQGTKGKWHYEMGLDEEVEWAEAGNVMETGQVH